MGVGCFRKAHEARELPVELLLGFLLPPRGLPDIPLPVPERDLLAHSTQELPNEY